ncbi:MMPL family transporter [Deltaproteobacteria bacterium TL4]
MIQTLKFINQYPKLIIICTLLISVFFYFYAQQKIFVNGQLNIDSTLEPFISRDSGIYEEFKKMRQIFGNEEALIIAVQPPPSKELNLAFFQKMDQLTRAIPEKMEHVERVLSLTNIPQHRGPCTGKSYFHQEATGSICVSILEQYAHEYACLNQSPSQRQNLPTPATDNELEDSLALDADFQGEEGGNSKSGIPGSFAENLEAEAQIGEKICTPDIYNQTRQQLLGKAEQQIQEAFQQIKQDTLIQKDLISTDFKTAALMVLFDAKAHPSNQKTQRALRQLLTEFQDHGFKIAYASQSRQEYEASKLVRRDLQRILPLSLLLIVLVLILFFTSIRGVIIPLMVVLLGILWTAGVFALMGERLNLVTMACPPTLICVGSAYVIYTLSQFYYEVRYTKDSRREIVNNTITHATIPLFVAALTTVGGFAALMVSPIPAIRELGLYSCIGVTFIFLLSLTLAPALLNLCRLPTPSCRAIQEGFLDNILHQLSVFIKEHSKAVVSGWLLIGFIAALGIFRVTVDTATTSFKAESEIVQDLNFIEDNLAGINNLRIVFKSPSLLSIETIKGINELKQWLLQAQKPNEIQNIEGLRIDKVYTPVEYLEIYYQGLEGITDAEVRHFFKTVNQHKVLNFYSEEQQLMQITLRLKLPGSTAFIQLRDLLDQKIPTFLPEVTTQYTGGGVLASESVTNIAKSQINSVILALCIIFTILSALFFSWKMGLIALYPSVVAVVVFFGMLGWLKIPIGITISVIASIALGIGVDDTIHFLTHYNENVKKTRHPKIASPMTLKQIGKAMIWTTVALTTGFGVFVISDMEAQILFGALVAFTLWICLMTDLTFLPSIMMETQLITVWDYVGLKFNDELLQKFDLFQNMSIREAKIATLMAYTVALEKGSVLFEENGYGNEMFVVLSGNICIFFDEKFHGEYSQLAQQGTGKTFGEMGLFRQSRRSASAKATEPTRLLVITQEILTRVQKRYPAIASKLFLNLSASLAASIKNTDDRMIGQIKELQQAGSEIDTNWNDDAPKQPPIFVNIFQNISLREREKFAKYCEIQSIPAGKTVFAIGDPGDYIMLVVSGKLVAYVDAAGEKVTMDNIRERDLIGELCLLKTHQRRHTTVTALENSEVLFLNAESLERMRLRSKRLAAKFSYNLVCMLSNRLEKSTSKAFKPRYANRFLLNTTTDIYFDTSRPHCAGIVINISLTGIELELGHFIETGEIIIVTIFFKKPTLDDFLNQNTFRLSCQVVWGRLYENEIGDPSWRFGLKFVMMTFEEQIALKNALEELFVIVTE